MTEIIPAILTSEVADFNKQMAILSPLSKCVQIDIVDGKFLPNTTITPKDIPEIYSYNDLEIHLMTLNPEKYYDQLPDNTKTIIVHYEASKDPRKLISDIPKKFQKGLAINPDTSIESIKSLIKDVDQILILGVEPGFQGRLFIPETLSRVSQLRGMDKKIKIVVDGGVDLHNAPLLKMAGADRLVVGSAIVKSKNQVGMYNKIKESVKE